jgi:hypothetical protein
MLKSPTQQTREKPTSNLASKKNSIHPSSGQNPLKSQRHQRIKSENQLFDVENLN